MRTEIIIETIEDLQERWEALKFQEGIDTLLITECFPKQGIITFSVHGLTMDLENEYAVCYDRMNTITDTLSILMIFLKDSLTKIVLVPISGGFRECLEFGESGTIYIEKAS